MIKLELYIREISRFLRTVTLKNRYFAEQMLENWVNPEYRSSLALSDHPYYRHLVGDYIVNANILTQLRSTLGIPTTIQVKAMVPILRNTSDSGYALASQNFQALRTITGYSGSPDINAIEAWIDHYFYTEYGLTKTVLINHQWLPTEMVYTRFDQVPIIKSFDTKITTLFTRKTINSRAQRKTRTVYKIPSNYYDQLIQQYPEEQDIIKAILYPIESVDVAYKADNYSILACDQSLLEVNERTSLYFALEETLAMIRKRWDVSAFTYEELYPLSMQAKIWTILIATLLSQRIKNIRTSEAHSFHIWNYLASHGLGEYQDVLTTKQTLFLYKNFPWIERNLGSDGNLLLLTHKLLHEHYVTVHDKTILQTTKSLREDPVASTPIVRSNEIQPEVMRRLKQIEYNDNTYPNKTLKALDELDAITYRLSDSEVLRLASPETIDAVYEKERDLGLEYQNDTEFALSTTAQTKAMSYTPHNQLPTKLLELRRATTEDYWGELYIRFVTESILYNVANGYADDVISFDYSDTHQSLSVKDLLLLFFYCDLQARGMYKSGQKIPTAVYLLLPYQHEFEPIPKQYHWYYQLRPTSAQLQIIPDELTIHSHTLDPILQGKFKLVNANEAVSNWRWVSEEGAQLSLTATESHQYVWVLGHADTPVHTALGVPYSSWLCYHPTWNYIVDDGREFECDSDIQVTNYHYVLDDKMPNYDTVYYYDASQPDKSLVHLIEQQAIGYIQLQRELMTSGRSRQYAAALEILDARTFHGWVNLNLSTYETYEQHIQHAPELKTIIDNIGLMDPKLQKSEYGYLADQIILTLYPLLNNSELGSVGTLDYTLVKLKKLIVQLCSYNVVFIDGVADSYQETLSGMCNVTLDYPQVVYGMSHAFGIGHTGHSLSVGLEFDEEWCYDPISDRKYLLGIDPPKLVHEVESHKCVDHQYVINSQLAISYNTPVVPIEVFDSEIKHGWEWSIGIDLIDRDHIRDWATPTQADIFAEVLDKLRWRFPDRELDYNSDLVKANVKYYHRPFEDAVFTSLLDYDSEWDYHAMPYLTPRPVQPRKLNS